MLKTYLAAISLCFVIVYSALAQQPAGLPGAAGGVIPDIHQVQLEDVDDASCEGPNDPNIPSTTGWCPNGIKPAFIILDPMITDGSVVIAHLGDIPLDVSGDPPFPFPFCQVRFINPTVGGFNFACNPFLGDLPADGTPLNYVVINP
jgi:hypothetical protein